MSVKRLATTSWMIGSGRKPVMQCMVALLSFEVASGSFPGVGQQCIVRTSLRKAILLKRVALQGAEEENETCCTGIYL